MENVISALAKKRSELSGLVAYYKKEIARLAEEVRMLDATIKLLDPGYPIRSIKTKRYQKQNDFFKHGEAPRILLDVLRKSGKSLSTSDIALAVMALKGIDEGRKNALQASILTTLHHQKKKGIVDCTGKDRTGNCLWELVD